jgi:hypothetical protein
MYSAQRQLAPSANRGEYLLTPEEAARDSRLRQKLMRLQQLKQKSEFTWQPNSKDAKSFTVEPPRLPIVKVDPMQIYSQRLKSKMGSNLPPKINTPPQQHSYAPCGRLRSPGPVRLPHQQQSRPQQQAVHQNNQQHPAMKSISKEEEEFQANNVTRDWMKNQFDVIVAKHIRNLNRMIKDEYHSTYLRTCEYIENSFEKQNRTLETRLSELQSRLRQDHISENTLQREYYHNSTAVTGAQIKKWGKRIVGNQTTAQGLMDNMLKRTEHFHQNHQIELENIRKQLCVYAEQAHQGLSATTQQIKTLQQWIEQQYRSFESHKDSDISFQKKLESVLQSSSILANQLTLLENKVDQSTADAKDCHDILSKTMEQHCVHEKIQMPNVITDIQSIRSETMQYFDIINEQIRRINTMLNERASSLSHPEASSSLPSSPSRDQTDARISEISEAITDIKNLLILSPETNHIVKVDLDIENHNKLENLTTLVQEMSVRLNDLSAIKTCAQKSVSDQQGDRLSEICTVICTIRDHLKTLSGEVSTLKNQEEHITDLHRQNQEQRITESCALYFSKTTDNIKECMTLGHESQLNAIRTMLNHTLANADSTTKALHCFEKSIHGLEGKFSSFDQSLAANQHDASQLTEISKLLATHYENLNIAISKQTDALQRNIATMTRENTLDGSNLLVGDIKLHHQSIEAICGDIALQLSNLTSTVLQAKGDTASSSQGEPQLLNTKDTALCIENTIRPHTNMVESKLGQLENTVNEMKLLVSHPRIGIESDRQHNLMVPSESTTIEHHNGQGKRRVRCWDDWLSRRQRPGRVQQLFIINRNSSPSGSSLSSSSAISSEDNNDHDDNVDNEEDYLSDGSSWASDSDSTTDPSESTDGEEEAREDDRGNHVRGSRKYSKANDNLPSRTMLKMLQRVLKLKKKFEESENASESDEESSSDDEESDLE